MGSTAGWGLPYPEPTEPVAGGADAIRALAEAVDDVQPATYVRGYRMGLTFNASGAVAFAHGQGVAPIAVVASALPGSTRITIHPGNVDSTFINLIAFRADTTRFEGAISTVHVVAVFPRSPANPGTDPAVGVDALPAPPVDEGGDL